MEGLSCEWAENKNKSQNIKYIIEKKEKLKKPWLITKQSKTNPH